MQLLFAFEYIILASTIIATFLKYTFSMVDSYMEVGSRHLRAACAATAGYPVKEQSRQEGIAQRHSGSPARVTHLMHGNVGCAPTPSYHQPAPLITSSMS